MDRIPDEIIIQILKYLEPIDIAHCQSLSSRFLRVARDSNTWKLLCFEHSQVEARKRRQALLLEQDAALVALRQAIAAGNAASHDSERLGEARRASKVRAIANWDPSYADENVSFYNEYIQRHARVSLRFLESIKSRDSQPEELESLGAAIFQDPSDQSLQKLISPMDDGSICLWSLDSSFQGKLHRCVLRHRTASTVVPTPKTRRELFLNEIEPTDNIAVDTSGRKVFISMLNTLTEVDLETMRPLKSTPYSESITAISPVIAPSQPITVATVNSLRLFDPRENTISVPSDPSTHIELIGGSPSSRPSALAPLSQPGAMSIVHADPHAIHVAGRFTSILHYDRRTWPRISGTTFSGARLSALASLPYGYIPRAWQTGSLYAAKLAAVKRAPGLTLIAAGEYRGKGSLELYGHGSSVSVPGDPAIERFYRNRQTAAASRLLSVATHGTRIVASDADGNMKWMERDGVSVVRTFNINTAGRTTADNARARAEETGLESEQAPTDAEDIVRKIIPRCATGGKTNDDSMMRDDLVIWTGDGRLGLVGVGSMADGDVDQDIEALHVEALDVEEQAREQQERQYGLRMRRILEFQSNAARFMPGLGL